MSGPRWEDLDPRSQIGIEAVVLAAAGQMDQAIALVQDHDDDELSLAFEVAMTAAIYFCQRIAPQCAPGPLRMTVDPEVATDVDRSERLAAFLAAVGNGDHRGAAMVFFGTDAEAPATNARNAGRLFVDTVECAAEALKAEQAALRDKGTS